MVFTPAAAGIRKSINVQESDRLASALEQELVTPRTGDKTGFDKAYKMIIGSNTAAKAILVYQYRGDLKSSARADGTSQPLSNIQGKSPGSEYVVIPMARAMDDPLINEDLTAIEGSVFLVKCTQLVFAAPAQGTGLVLGTPGQIKDPKDITGAGPAIANSDLYPEAVVAFAADFHMLPSKAPSFFSGGAFAAAFSKAKNPVFSRNLAVRR